jgi:hypothetical protein
MCRKTGTENGTYSGAEWAFFEFWLEIFCSILLMLSAIGSLSNPECEPELEQDKNALRHGALCRPRP